jgi:hypothetical protein
MDLVTVEHLRDLLDAPDETALVVEEGSARVVPRAEAGAGLSLLTRADLLGMLGGDPGDLSDETLRQVAARLDVAVRQQGG